MKIQNLHLTAFGKFKDKRISFSEGINYIYGENEAGKSTIMAFIKAMLYGFTGRGAEGDRKRYSPWDGTRLSGEMTVTLENGKQVIISRTAGRTPAQDTLSILDAVTGAPCEVDLLEEIGVGEDAFLKTVFIKQMAAELGGADEELTDKLLNLAGSGDADTGFDEAVGYLKDEIRAYKHQRGEGGRIFEIKKKLSALETEIREAEEKKRELSAYIIEEKEVAAALTALEKQRSDGREQIKAAKAGRARATLLEAEKRLCAMRDGQRETDELLLKTNEKRKVLAAFETPIAESAYAAAESTEPLALAERAARKKSILFWVLFTIAAILSAGSFITLHSGIGGVSLVLAVLFATLSLLAGRQKKEAARKRAQMEEREEERRQSLSVYGCTSIKEYTEKLSEKLALDTRAEALSEKKALLAAEEEKAEEAVNRARAEFATFENITPQDMDVTLLENEASRIEAEYAAKIKRAATLEGILKGGVYDKNTVDVLFSEKTRLLEELEEAENTYAALQLALETLEEVFTELSHDFTPRINALASQYMQKLTGKEEALLLDKKYSVTMGRGDHKPLWAFSGGTIDQAYFATRLALSELVLAEAQMPVFLDDSFLQYDAKREENAVSLLREIAKTRQVFWFSCRERETKDITRIEL